MRENLKWLWCKDQRTWYKIASKKKTEKEKVNEQKKKLYTWKWVDNSDISMLMYICVNRVSIHAEGNKKFTLWKLVLVEIYFKHRK